MSRRFERLRAQAGELLTLRGEMTSLDARLGNLLELPESAARRDDGRLEAEIQRLELILHRLKESIADLGRDNLALRDQLSELNGGFENLLRPSEDSGLAAHVVALELRLQSIEAQLGAPGAGKGWLRRLRRLFSRS